MGSARGFTRGEPVDFYFDILQRRHRTPQKILGPVGYLLDSPACPIAGVRLSEFSPFDIRRSPIQPSRYLVTATHERELGQPLSESELDPKRTETERRQRNAIERRGNGIEHLLACMI